MIFFIFIRTSNFWYSSLNFQNCSYVTTYFNWVLNAHKKVNFFSQFFATCYLPTLFHSWQSKCFFLLSVQSKFCGKLCSTYKIQAFPIRNSNLNIVSAYPPSGRNMVTVMTLKNSKLVMVKFIWQLLFWHSYRRLLSHTA